MRKSYFAGLSFRVDGADVAVVMAGSDDDLLVPAANHVAVLHLGESVPTFS